MYPSGSGGAGCCGGCCACRRLVAIRAAAVRKRKSPVFIDSAPSLFSRTSGNQHEFARILSRLGSACEAAVVAPSLFRTAPPTFRGGGAECEGLIRDRAHILRML